MYHVIVHKRAGRYLKKLDKTKKEKVKETLKQLAKDPLGFPGVKHMLGQWKGYHRIRIGDLRVIFWIDKDNSIVYIDHVGPRGDIYK